MSHLLQEACTNLQIIQTVEMSHKATMKFIFFKLVYTGFFDSVMPSSPIYWHLISFQDPAALSQNITL